MGMQLENSKVVKAAVVPGQQIYARKGSMLFYTGDVRFSPYSLGGAVGTAGAAMGGMLSGMAGVATTMMRGEHIPLILTEGSGQAFFGHDGCYIDVIALDGVNQLVVEASRLLAYDGRLQTAIVPLTSQGGIRGALRGAATGQGMFTTQLSGQGEVAVLSHGGTVTIEVGAGRPMVCVDPQAYVAHRGHIQVDLASHGGLRDVVGRGSGEALQLRLSGQGTVWVQASEKKF